MGSRVAVIALVGASVLLALASYPLEPLTPHEGLDPSWRAALHMIARDGLHWGTDAQFTYGPLGFLDVAVLWGETTGRVAIVYQLLERVLVCGVLILALRRTFPIWICLPLALLVSSLAVDPVLPGIGFIGAAAVVATPLRGRSAVAAIVGLALLGAFETLIKLNAGVTMLGLAGLAALLHPERRRLVPVLIGAAAGAYLLGWLVAGQSLGALPEYLGGAVQIISGYSQTMMVEDPTRLWEYAAAGIVFGIGAYACWVSGARGSLDVRVPLLVLWAAFTFTAFKSGFVRHDGHGIIFFATCLVGICGIAWSREQRGLAATVIAALAGLAFATVPTQDFSYLEPRARWNQAWEGLDAVVDAQKRREVAVAGRDEVLNGAGLPFELVEAARREPSVAVYPWELSVAWAGNLRFRPLPNFQDYQAYTDGLDDQNADRLADDDEAPAAILLHEGDGAVDGRLTAFNTPRTMREMVCRYRVAERANAWALLRRSADRCATEPRLVGSVRARWGERMPVPRPRSPRSFVFVRVHGAEVHGLERVRSLLFRAHDRVLLLDDGQPRRLAPGVAAGGAIVRSGPRADFPGAVRVASQSPVLGVDRKGEPDRSKRELRFDFYEQVLSG